MENFEFDFSSVSDEVKESADKGVFGLNAECELLKIEVINNAGKDKSEKIALDVYVKVHDKEYRSRVFDPTGTELTVWENGSSRKIDERSPSYADVLKKEIAKTSATALHIVKAAGVTDEKIQAGLKKFSIKTFGDYVNMLVSALPKDYVGKSVDIFLQYQASIKEGFEIKFLELPKNMTSGYWIVPSTPNTKWVEMRDEKGLHYVKEDDHQIEHKFKRSASWLERDNAKSASEPLYFNQPTPSVQQVDELLW